MHALKKDGVDLSYVPPRYRSSYFLHIWGNGYSAGYYAYLWTQMLADDAFEWFKEHGGMTRDNGDRFRAMILSRGNTVELAKLYNDWRGKDPSHRADADRSWFEAGAGQVRISSTDSRKGPASCRPFLFSMALEYGPFSCRWQVWHREWNQQRNLARGMRFRCAADSALRNDRTRRLTRRRATYRFHRYGQRRSRTKL